MADKDLGLFCDRIFNEVYDISDIYEVVDYVVNSFFISVLRRQPYRGFSIYTKLNYIEQFYGVFSDEKNVMCNMVYKAFNDIFGGGISKRNYISDLISYINLDGVAQKWGGLLMPRSNYGNYSRLYQLFWVYSVKYTNLMYDNLSRIIGNDGEIPLIIGLPCSIIDYPELNSKCYILDKIVAPNPRLIYLIVRFIDKIVKDVSVNSGNDYALYIQRNIEEYLRLLSAVKDMSFVSFARVYGNRDNLTYEEYLLLREYFAGLKEYAIGELLGDVLVGFKCSLSYSDECEDIVGGGSDEGDIPPR